jgi:hypothetical protein
MGIGPRFAATNHRSAAGTLEPLAVQFFLEKLDEIFVSFIAGQSISHGAQFLPQFMDAMRTVGGGVILGGLLHDDKPQEQKMIIGSAGVAGTQTPPHQRRVMPLLPESQLPVKTKKPLVG